MITGHRLHVSIQLAHPPGPNHPHILPPRPLASVKEAEGRLSEKNATALVFTTESRKSCRITTDLSVNKPHKPCPEAIL